MLITDLKISGCLDTDDGVVFAGCEQGTASRRGCPGRGAAAGVAGWQRIMRAESESKTSPCWPRNPQSRNHRKATRDRAKAWLKGCVTAAVKPPHGVNMWQSAKVDGRGCRHEDGMSDKRYLKSQ